MHKRTFHTICICLCLFLACTSPSGLSEKTNISDRITIDFENTNDVHIRF